MILPMLSIIIPEQELFNENTNEFLVLPEKKLALEHSLVSISKWESKWKKPFFSNNLFPKTNEEIRDYVRCMTLTQNVSPDVYSRIDQTLLDEINKYIEDPMTATTFSGRSDRDSQVITSELIYYWMSCFNLPVEYQKWHINRLLTLIRICTLKSQKGKKMPVNDVRALYHRINEQRKKELNTLG